MARRNVIVDTELVEQRSWIAVRSPIIVRSCQCVERLNENFTPTATPIISKVSASNGLGFRCEMWPIGVGKHTLTCS